MADEYGIITFNIHYDGQVHVIEIPNELYATQEKLREAINRHTGVPITSIHLQEHPGQEPFSYSNLRHMKGDFVVNLDLTVQHPPIYITATSSWDADDNRTYKVRMFRDDTVEDLKSMLSSTYPRRFPSEDIALSYNDVTLSDDKATLQSYDITANCLIHFA